MDEDEADERRAPLKGFEIAVVRDIIDERERRQWLLRLVMTISAYVGAATVIVAAFRDWIVSALQALTPK